MAPVAIGSAVITTGGLLLARYVIHAPTMRMPVERSSAEAVVKAVRAALVCATQQGFRSISFPGMGTGTGGVPYELAATAMLREIREYLEHEPSEIGLVAYNDLLCAAFLCAARAKP